MLQAANHVIRTSAVVLLSGGLDSSAALHFVVAQKWPVSGVHVNYGHPAALREREAAKAMASIYAIELSMVDISGLIVPAGGEVIGRNALLAVLGLMTLDTKAGIVVLGLHAGTEYADSTAPFLELIQGLFDTYTQGTVTAFAPFLSWTKRDVWDYARSQGIATSLTYSCELGVDQPCDQCKSCGDLKALHAAT